MGEVLFVVWRESVEAMLVVGILYAWIRHSGQRQALPYLWGGVALGLLAALLLGAGLQAFSELLSGDTQDYFQSALAFVATFLIVQMVFWMRKHGRTLKREMESALQQHAETARWWGILLLAALAVAREGSETVIFLYGLGFGRDGTISGEMIFAVLAGFALAFLCFHLLQLGGRFFSWRIFFRVTEILLLLLAAGLLMSGVDRLISLEILPTLGDMVWNSSQLIDDSKLLAALTGYRARPTGIHLLVYLIYWAAIWLLLRRALAAPQVARAPR